MTTSRIPSPLSSYLRLPPEASLALVTSTVNTTANWVLLRYIYAALNQQENGRNAIASLRADNTGVVLVSYLRDSTFWKTEARRAVVGVS
jgi:elongator complex protein 6